MIMMGMTCKFPWVMRLTNWMRQYMVYVLVWLEMKVQEWMELRGWLWLMLRVLM